MSDTPADEGPQIAGHGVIVRAQNGDVIRYDPSGLVMRLSDRVIADIALRLGQGGAARAEPERAAAPTAADPDTLLDGIDAWGVTFMICIAMPVGIGMLLLRYGLWGALAWAIPVGAVMLDRYRWLDGRDQ